MDSLTRSSTDLDRLLAELSRLGVTISAEGDRLILRGREGAIAPALRETVARHKPALLERLRRDKDDRLLSLAQEGLWFLEEMGRAGSAYHCSVILHLQGVLDAAALRRSLTEIVRRHEPLRTVFRAGEGGPRHSVQPPYEVDLAEHDLRELPPEEQRRFGLELARAAHRLPFDLARGPLLRGQLFQIGAHEHALALFVHHLVFDAWSGGVLCAELAALYPAFAAGAASPLPPLPARYADFVVHEQALLRGPRGSELRDFWRHRLEGMEAAELPTDHPCPANPTFRAARETLTLPPTLVGGLRALSQHEGATLFMVLLAGFKALVHRYTGKSDVVVATPSANRGRAEFEGLIGYFVNTLVLRTTVTGGLSFRELLARVRASAVAAYEHEELPFASLVEGLQPRRDSSRHQVFQVLFNMLSVDSRPIEVPGLRLTPTELGAEIAGFDLTVHAVEAGGLLVVSLNFNPDVFEATTVREMLGHYRDILEAVGIDPGRRLAQLPPSRALPGPAARAGESPRTPTPLVTQPAGGLSEPSFLWPAETSFLPPTGVRDDSPYPREATVTELFEGQVERTPDELAVVFGEERLTYRELNARANRLAHRLRG
ncbi:MAG TPA: condensation domain-containing protein, partial [Vicinamibacteria bacterium]|nr:condensation domain-containing protein [Vicinamibacteria bacterium]